MADEVQSDEQYLEEPEVEVESSSDGQDWDRDRQFRDELSAANRREGELNAKYEQAQGELSRLRDSKDEAAQEEDLTDYDTLVNAVKRQNEVTKKLETDLAKTRNENKTLHVDLSKIQSESQVVKGKQILDQEVTSLEKEFGTQAVTNKVIASVEKEYIDNDVSKMPTKPRVTWIKDKLRLRFMQETSKTKSHSGSSANDNAGIKVDTGTGGSKPSDEIPEGDYKTVSKAMAERDARLGV